MAITSEEAYFSILSVLYVERKKKNNVEGWEFHPIELLIYCSFFLS